MDRLDKFPIGKVEEAQLLDWLRHNKDKLDSLSNLNLYKDEVGWSSTVDSVITDLKDSGDGVFTYATFLRALDTVIQNNVETDADWVAFKNSVENTAIIVLPFSRQADDFCENVVLKVVKGNIYTYIAVNDGGFLYVLNIRVVNHQLTVTLEYITRLLNSIDIASIVDDGDFYFYAYYGFTSATSEVYTSIIEMFTRSNLVDFHIVFSGCSVYYRPSQFTTFPQHYPMFTEVGGIDDSGRYLLFMDGVQDQKICLTTITNPVFKEPYKPDNILIGIKKAYGTYSIYINKTPQQLNALKLENELNAKYIVFICASNPTVMPANVLSWSPTANSVLIQDRYYDITIEIFFSDLSDCSIEEQNDTFEVDDVLTDENVSEFSNLSGDIASVLNIDYTKIDFRLVTKD